MEAGAREVLIAANPMSGAASSAGLVASLASHLEGRGLKVRVIESLELLQSEASRLWAAGCLRAVVSAGGDGTVAALANLLPAEVPILILPLGTENLLAKHWGLTNDVHQAAATLLEGTAIRMDVGLANGKIFLVMLSCGFDAEVVRRMHKTRRGHINRWSYSGPIISSLARYSFPQIPHVFDSEQEAGEAAWLFVFNVPRYAASLNFCPQADPTDGQLDVCTFRHSGAARGMFYLLQLWFNRHQKLGDYHHRRCRKIRIEAPLGGDGKLLEVPFQIDGDPGGVLPLEISIVPQRLKLLIPKS